MRVLVVNAGSSSIKIRLLDPDNTLLHEVNLDADRGQPEAGAVNAAIKSIGPVDAVGHRVVHGGTSFTGPVIVDAAVLTELDQLVALAPLHQPPALGGSETIIDAATYQVRGTMDLGGEAGNTSHTAIRQSRVPRFLISDSTRTQNLAPSPSPCSPAHSPRMSRDEGCGHRLGAGLGLCG